MARFCEVAAAIYPSARRQRSLRISRLGEVVLDGGGLGQCFLRCFLVRFGFFGEVGFVEELGDLLFLGGEGAGVGDALELLWGEGGVSVLLESIGFLILVWKVSGKNRQHDFCIVDNAVNRTLS